jgi:hypothetical protein
MADRCALCHRESEHNVDYCSYHRLALENLKSSYPLWRDALDYDWVSFLREVSERPETGIWARDVALHELDEVPS